MSRRDQTPSLRYPLIEGYEPTWYVGDSKPAFYTNDRGDTRETPDYDTWTGEWTYFRDFGSFM